MVRDVHHQGSSGVGNIDGDRRPDEATGSGGGRFARRLRFVGGHGVFALLLILTAACSVLSSTPPPILDRTGPRLGILPFDVQGAIDRDLGHMAQDILTTAFFEDTDLRLVERAKLAELFAEQKLSRLDRDVLPLEAIVQGHITAISPSKESRNWLLFKTVYRTLEVVVDIRCIDVRTGEVIYSAKGREEITATNELTLLFLWTIMESDKEVSQDAIRGAIEDFLEDSVEGIARVVKDLPIPEEKE